MTNSIYYKRITGSNIQGDAYSVTESSGTLVIANNGDLRLHDGSTAGGNPVGGGSSGWQLTSSTAVVSLTSDGTLTIPGTIVGNSGALDLNYDGSVVLSGIPSVDAVIQTTNSNSSNTSTWTFGTDGGLTLPLGGYITAPSAMGSNTVIQAPGSNRALLQNSDGTNLVAADDQGVAMTTVRGTVQFGYNLEAPGVPTHFHINKLDQSFDLFFGDDSNYFHLPAGGGSPVIGANDGSSGQKLWTFGQDGSLTLPGIVIGNVAGNIVSGSYYAGFDAFGDFVLPSSTYFGQGANLGMIVSANTTGAVIEAPASGQSLTLNTNSGAPQYNWVFDATGTLTLPQSNSGAAVISAGTVGLEFTSNGHALQLGTDGTLSLPSTGRLTFPDTTVQTTAWTGTILTNQISDYSPSTSTLVNGSYTVTLGSTGTLTLPATNNITAANTPQVGYRIVVTDDTIGGADTGNNDGSTWMEFDASKTSFVNQIWNPYCVGAPDSIIGWTVTAADNTVSHILHANNSGLAYAIIVDQYAFGPGPYTFQSPDYVAASTNDVHIEAGEHDWTFGTDGTLTLPEGLQTSSSETLNLFTNYSSGNINIGGISPTINMGGQVNIGYLNTRIVFGYSGVLTDGTSFTNFTGTPASNGTWTPAIATGTNGNGGPQNGVPVSFTVHGAFGVYNLVALNFYGQGQNYAVGDTITIAGTQLGGTSPANDLTFTIAGEVGDTYPNLGPGSLVFDYGLGQFFGYTQNTSYTQAYPLWRRLDNTSASSLVNGSYTVSLGTDGGITFPDATVQTTAFTGTIAYSNVTGAPAAFNTGTLVAQAISASTATNAAYAYSFNTGTLVAQAISATTATNAAYAYSFNTGTLVARAVSATTATNAAYAYSFNTGTLVATAVTAQSLTAGVTLTAVANTGTTSTTAAGLGYIGMPQNSTATSYTLVAGDQGKHVYVTATGQTITVPANATTAFPIGTAITFISGSGATTTIAIATDTMYLAGTGTTGTRTLAAYGMATAVKVAATTWYINGTGLT